MMLSQPISITSVTSFMTSPPNDFAFFVAARISSTSTYTSHPAGPPGICFMIPPPVPFPTLIIVYSPVGRSLHARSPLECDRLSRSPLQSRVSHRQQRPRFQLPKIYRQPQTADSERGYKIHPMNADMLAEERRLGDPINVHQPDGDHQQTYAE